MLKQIVFLGVAGVTTAGVGAATLAATADYIFAVAATIAACAVWYVLRRVWIQQLAGADRSDGL
jgi:hypothetical protein